MRANILLGWLGCAALLLCGGARAATIYKWFDENGGVHYSSERPPSHIKAQIVDTAEPVRAEPRAQRQRQQSQPRSEPETPAEELQSPEPNAKRPTLKEREAAFEKRRAARLENESREEQQKESEQRRLARACDRARASLARTVAAPPRLAQKDGKASADVWVYRGDQAEVPSMNNAERSEAIDVLEAFIAKNCAKRNRQ
jgi:membrane protein involved in colicin uptake